MTKTDLKSLELTEMEQLLTQLGEPRYRGHQVCQWVLQKGVASFEEMTNLSKDLQGKLAEVAYIGNLKILAKQVSRQDETVKYLFGLMDDQTVESVLMTHRYGVSACVSSQVGCRLACRFCASTLGGLVRNLTAGEIYDQVLAMERDGGRRVDNVVIMGSGEPLENYDQTLKFIRLITAPYGLNIGARHITLSTSGVVPRIYDLAREGLPITLSVSLHAPNDEIRDQIMPVNKKFPIKELITACREYISITSRRITFEYALMAGINDSPRQAEELARLIKGIMCHVNLIPVNPVAEIGLAKPEVAIVRRFRQVLEEAGIEATVRRELGSDIDAACGQLRRRVLQEK
ncbi:MAG: 23S rRNA (adenine(2503)-C(2))-methyltransferase RlmN [Thermincolia bacterium]